jgi:hypothetical protein
MMTTGLCIRVWSELRPGQRELSTEAVNYRLSCGREYVGFPNKT